MKTKQLFFLLLAGICYLSACNLNSDPVEYTYDNVMIVVNQGKFFEGNGSLAYYHETDLAIENNVIHAANGYDLGATIQSVAVASNGNVFVICNEPDKVVVFDAITKKVTEAELFKDDVSDPRYMAIDNDYLYITNWGPSQDAGGGWLTYPNSYVLRIDRYTGKADANHIPCGSDAEGIISIGNKLYVAAGEGVVVIDKSSRTAVDTIIAPTFTGGAKHLVTDKRGHLWASYPDSGLLSINLSTGAREEIAIPVDWMGQIAINVDADKIYTYETTFDASYVAQEAKIYELDIATNTSKEFATGHYFFSIGVSPATGNVYTAEVNNFQSPSELLVYDASGKLLDQELTGVGTCDFKFFSVINQK